MIAAVAFTDVGSLSHEILHSPLEDVSRREWGVGERRFFAIVHRRVITWPLLAKVNPPAIINASIVALANVSSLTTKHNLRRFVFRSSIEVYGGAPGGPPPEQHALNPISRYGVSIAAGDAVLSGLAEECGRNAVSLIPRLIDALAQVAGAFADLGHEVTEGSSPFGGDSLAEAGRGIRRAGWPSCAVSGR